MNKNIGTKIRWMVGCQEPEWRRGEPQQKSYKGIFWCDKNGLYLYCGGNCMTIYLMQYETWPWLVAKTNMWWQQKVISWCRFGWGSAVLVIIHILDSVKNKRSQKSWTGVACPISKRQVDMNDTKYPSHNNPVPI